MVLLTIYKWDADKYAWVVAGKSGGTLDYITTVDVNTTADIPTFPTYYKGSLIGPDAVPDEILKLVNQKLVNWALATSLIQLDSGSLHIMG